MGFQLRHIRDLRTILLSSAVVVGCAVHDAEQDAPTVLHHEGHDHAPTPTPAPKPAAPAVDAGSATAPVDCASTYDAIQTAIFDSTTYSCSNAACHGTAGGHIDLRKGFSYDSLLGLAPAGAGHDHDAHDDHGDHHDHAEHDEHAGHDDGHAHEEGEAHDHALAVPGFDVLHHEGEDHGEHGHGAHVIAGEPEKSVLYDNLRAKVEGIPTKLGGTPMPLGSAAITRAELEAVERWIAAGAPRTGFVAGTEAVCPKTDHDAGH